MNFVRRTRLLLPALNAVTGISLLGLSGFWLATRQPVFGDIRLETDSLFQSSFYRAFNPNGNPAFSDVCARRVRISQIKPELVQDWQNGGSRLIESYCAGVWGGWGFAIQRNLVQMFSNKKASTDLRSKKEILESSFHEGTMISSEFEVISKTPTSVIFRGGTPASLPDEPRDFDSLTETSINLDFERGFAEFRFKCIFFAGSGQGSPPPLPEFLTPFHFQYVRALIQSGVSKCLS